MALERARLIVELQKRAEELADRKLSLPFDDRVVARELLTARAGAGAS